METKAFSFEVTIIADFTMPVETIEMIFREWVNRSNLMGMLWKYSPSQMYMEEVRVRMKKEN